MNDSFASFISLSIELDSENGDEVRMRQNIISDRSLSQRSFSSKVNNNKKSETRFGIKFWDSFSYTLGLLNFRYILTFYDFLNFCYLIDEFNFKTLYFSYTQMVKVNTASIWRQYELCSYKSSFIFYS